MKIQISNQDKGNLKILKGLIDEALNINFEEMEFTEDNLKKAIQVRDKINEIMKYQFRYRGIEIKIVNSDGAELTTIK